MTKVPPAIDVLRIFTGHRLRQIRRVYGISIKELAQEMGYRPSYLCDVECQCSPVPRLIRRVGSRRERRRKWKYRSEWVALYLRSVKAIVDRRLTSDSIDHILKNTRGLQPPKEKT